MCIVNGTDSDIEHVRIHAKYQSSYQRKEYIHIKEYKRIRYHYAVEYDSKESY